MNEYHDLREWITNCIQNLIEHEDEYKMIVKGSNYKKILDHVKTMNVDKEHKDIIKIILIWIRGDKNNVPLPFMKYKRQSCKYRALLHEIAEIFGLGHITIQIDTKGVFCEDHKKWCDSYYDNYYDYGKEDLFNYRCPDYDCFNKCYPDKRNVNKRITYITFPNIKDKEQLDTILFNHGINPYDYECEIITSKSNKFYESYNDF